MCVSEMFGYQGYIHAHYSFIFQSTQMSAKCRCNGENFKSLWDSIIYSGMVSSSVAVILLFLLLLFFPLRNKDAGNCCLKQFLQVSWI